MILFVIVVLAEMVFLPKLSHTVLLHWHVVCFPLFVGLIVNSVFNLKTVKLNYPQGINKMFWSELLAEKEASREQREAEACP